MNSTIRVAVLFGSICAMLGCTTTKPPQTDSQPLQPPKPFTINISTSLKLDLPEEISKQTGMPAKILGELSFSMNSVAIEANPIRSRYDGQISVRFSDLEQTHKYMDFTSELNGEYDGKPNDCLSLGFKQATGMLSLINEASTNLSGEKKRQTKPGP